jgi:serine/threonine-protein kinase haspin
VEFEHRDLHWGNLLIAPATTKAIAFRLDGVDILVEAAGVRASLIDFSASRLIAEDGSLAFGDLSQDPEIFEGPKGQVQFDTYRYMAALTGGDWAAPTPGTNCLWMAYLAETLAATKIGGGSRASGAKRTLREFEKRCVGYGSCREMVTDELFEGLWVRA